MATLAVPLARAPSRVAPATLSRWLLGVAALVFAMVVVGGITRLTESGLSMVRWEPLSGAIPPLSQADWAREFAAYQASPQYRQVNAGMSLAAFKGIFFWEYVHRLLGRLIGVAYALPLLWFWARRAIPPGYGPRLVGLLALGGLQGAIGWWMVYSGLIDRPAVAHERLAAHLVTALLIMSAMLWTALDLRGVESAPRPSTGLRATFALFAALLLAQVTWGAFTAGLRAGWFVNSWPLMEGYMVHPEAWAAARRSALAWLDDPIAVQTVHRKLALLVGSVGLGLAWALARAGVARPAAALAAAIALQFTLGVLTLVNQVPLALGVAHQAGGALLVAATVWAAHSALAAPRGRR